MCHERKTMSYTLISSLTPWAKLQMLKTSISLPKIGGKQNQNSKELQSAQEHQEHQYPLYRITQMFKIIQRTNRPDARTNISQTGSHSTHCRQEIHAQSGNDDRSDDKYTEIDKKKYQYMGQDTCRYDLFIQLKTNDRLGM